MTYSLVDASHRGCKPERMAGRRYKQQRVIYAGLALIIGIATAVTIMKRPNSTEIVRFSTVFSDFVNLSAGPDPKGLDFLSRDRVQRANRNKRLSHIDPDVLDGHAKVMDIDVDILRMQITDPSRTNAFDYTGVVFESPMDMETGMTDHWAWARIVERAESRVSKAQNQANCGQETRCRMWILYWDAKSWYYAPMGSSALNEAFLYAHPEARSIMKMFGGYN